MRRSRGQVLTGLVGGLLTLLIGIWLAASFVAERITLHPRHWGVGPTPSQLGHAYEDVSFKDHAGLTLRGWWIPGTNQGTVVMVHGWTSSRREPMTKAGFVSDAGYNVLVFDLRGHGQSDGSYTSLGYDEPDDVASAVAFAHSRALGPIALLGYSMGAALVVETGARDSQVAAVIEDSGYGNLANVFRSGFQRVTGLPANPFGAPLVAMGQLDLSMQMAKVRPVDDAARLAKPLLAIVGTSDRVVPPSEGFDIYRAAPGPKQLLVLPGVGHVDGYRADPAQYRQAVLGFLARSIG